MPFQRATLQCRRDGRVSGFFLVETLHNLLLAVHHEVVVDEERRWRQANAQHASPNVKKALAKPAAASPKGTTSTS